MLRMVLSQAVYRMSVLRRVVDRKGEVLGSLSEGQSVC